MESDIRQGETNRILDYAKWVTSRSVKNEKKFEGFDRGDLVIENFNSDEQWFNWTRLAPQLVYNLHVMQGYTKLTPLQETCLEVLLNERKENLLALSPTGTGKTAAFCLPAVQIAKNYQENRVHGPSVIILCNTMNLAYQTHKHIKKFIGKIENPELATIPMSVGINAFGLYKGGTYTRDWRLKPSIVIATMGKLTEALRNNKLSLNDLRLLIIDEADKMVDTSSFGYELDDFMKSIPQDVYKRLQVALYTATFNNFFDDNGDVDLSHFVLSNLYKEELPVCIKVAQNNTTIQQRIIRIQVDSNPLSEKMTKKERSLHCLENLTHYKKLAWVRALLKNDKEKYFDTAKGRYTKTAIIFVNTIAFCNFLTGYLDGYGFDVLPCTSELTQLTVQNNIEALEEGKVQALISTNKLARGQDIQGLFHVIIYQMSNEFEDYKHRIGRTGRLGKKGMASTLVDYTDEKHFWYLYNYLIETRQKIPRWLYDYAQDYVYPHGERDI